MRLAMEKAKQVGVGIVTIFNSGHLGAVGHHSMVAARDDMVGMCMTATGAQVVPTYASEPRFGTNPISIAAQRGTKPSLFRGTSAIAGNKVRLAARVGAPLLPGWVARQGGIRFWKKRRLPNAASFGIYPSVAPGSRGLIRATDLP